MKSINPATEQLVREFDEHSPDAVDRKLRQAEQAFASRRTTSFSERAAMMTRAAAVLRERRAEFSQLMTAEMGKPISQAEGEIDKCAWVCEFYAEQAESFLSPRAIDTDAAESFVRYDPVGPVLAVMPWNFPFWQVFRFAAPALMAGNVGVLKHAGNVCGCALAIEDVFQQAGLPEGVFQTLLIRADAVADVIASPVVKAVTLTGSEKAGMAVAAEAGKQIKKTVLELGGSDPFIVLADADVQHVGGKAALARTINSGQSCIAAKRFIVADTIADDLTNALVAEFEKLIVGDPMNHNTNIGPLARGDLRDELHDQVQRSIAAGAELRTGGQPLNHQGFYYPPTLLDRVTSDMAAFREETFGPVAAVIRARDEEHAVALANDSPFGLGASIWTGDVARGKDLAARVEAGAIFVNEIVKSDPRVPFGGIKRSGYGRELSDVGIREFVNVKTVWVA